jgi:hypothetical protein
MVMFQPLYLILGRLANMVDEENDKCNWFPKKDSTGTGQGTKPHTAICFLLRPNVVVPLSLRSIADSSNGAQVHESKVESKVESTDKQAANQPYLRPLTDFMVKMFYWVFYRHLFVTITDWPTFWVLQAMNTT